MSAVDYLLLGLCLNATQCPPETSVPQIYEWGKRDEELILPVNDSLSATLCLNQMCAKTTVMASPDFKENRIWLNGKEESFHNPRLQSCIKEIRIRAQIENKLMSSEILSWNIHICSENNFPTAAGLASSAAGYACLVHALAKLYSVKSDISSLARRGSGSACRSVFGGWVRWFQGKELDGSDSVAKQVAPANHWDDMRVLILVVNDQKKKISSATGMKNSVKTSELLKYRAERCVPKRVEEITKAIKERDFETFGRITMQDSNQFHAVCLDTFPPCIYMNDVSRWIVDLVHAYNEAYGSIKVAYTFDAGPNACLYMLKKEVSQFTTVLNSCFPVEESTVTGYFKGLPVEPEPLPENISKTLNLTSLGTGLLKYILHTKVGDGPKELVEDSQHLLTGAGLPKNMY